MLSEIIYMFKLNKAGKVVASIVGAIVLSLLLVFIFIVVDKSVIDSIIDKISILLGWVLSIGSIIGCFIVVVKTIMELVYHKKPEQKWKDIYREEVVKEYIDRTLNYKLILKLINVNESYFNEDLVRSIIHSYIFSNSMKTTLEENNVDEDHSYAVKAMINLFREETGFSAIYV